MSNFESMYLGNANKTDVLLHTSNGTENIQGESLLCYINNLCDEELFEESDKKSSQAHGKLIKEEHKETGNVSKIVWLLLTKSMPR